MISPFWKSSSIYILRSISTLSNIVRIVEVGPRDGLQNEKQIIPTNIKVEMINRLSEAGLSHIECGSFVDPKRLPQLSDSETVINQMSRHPFIRYTALVPNIKGLERALNCNINDIAIFGAASELFSKKNINCTIEESFKRFRKVVIMAKSNNIAIRGYISCIIACPYAGKTDPKLVTELTNRMLEMGCYEVSLGDTIGVGTPDQISELLKYMLPFIDANKLALHCHDTNGQAIANITRGIELGIRCVDSSISGLGGCPYAGPGASGNVATEKVVSLLDKLGYLEETIQKERVVETASWINSIIKKDIK